MPGALEAIVTLLEMSEQPRHTRPLAPPGKIALLRAESIPVPYYRWLYDQVGRDRHWVDRKRMSDDELAAIVQHPDVEVYVLYRGGVPAGFFELDARARRKTVLGCLGVVPDVPSHGFVTYLIQAAIEQAWSRPIDRLQAEASSLDPPGTLPLYQRFGFQPVGQSTRTVRPFQPVPLPPP
jgi:GNAT superfamily N-acetyltransferase